MIAVSLVLRAANGAIRLCAFHSLTAMSAARRNYYVRTLLRVKRLYTLTGCQKIEYDSCGKGGDRHIVEFIVVEKVLYNP